MDNNLTGSTAHGSPRIAPLHACSRLASLASATLVFLALTGCGTNAPASGPAAAPPAAETKRDAPAIPDEMQGAAKSLLGSDVQVLVFGDLAKNGNQEFLAANVLPKTPTNTIPGTIISRAVIVEKQDGKWTEVLHVDEHLKNQRGVLGSSPRQPVTGWRLQYEQDPVQGLQLYFTPENTGDTHVLPIGVRFNPKTKRYQSTDRAFEKFLPEVTSSGETPRSSLR